MNSVCTWVAGSTTAAPNQPSITRSTSERLERVDEVAEPQQGARCHDRGQAGQCQGFPEVGELVQRVSGERVVDRVPLVLVGEEPRTHELDVVDLAVFGRCGQAVEHWLGDVNRDDPTAVGCDGEGEDPRPAPHVDDGRAPVQAAPSKRGDVGRRVVLLLGVVAGDVRGVEVLGPGVVQLVRDERPAQRSAWPRRAHGPSCFQVVPSVVRHTPAPGSSTQPWVGSAKTMSPLVPRLEKPAAVRLSGYRHVLPPSVVS